MQGGTAIVNRCRRTSDANPCLSQFQDSPGINHCGHVARHDHRRTVAEFRVARATETNLVGKGIRLGTQIAVDPAISHDPNNVTRMRIGKCVGDGNFGNVVERLGKRTIRIGRRRLVDKNRLAFNCDADHTGAKRNAALADQHDLRKLRCRGHRRPESGVDLHDEFITDRGLRRSGREVD